MGYFDKLKTLIKSYLPETQVAAVHAAYRVALKAHQKQFRQSGDPYITHPVAVACILAELKLDHETLMAALLHDVLEDSHIEHAELATAFGQAVADLVDGVSKLTQIHFESKAEARAEYVRKMVLAMARDIRVIMVKLADRLHNMRTLGALPPIKKRRIARETLDIYAPIAHRLGMRHVYTELEELSFMAMYPMRYRVVHEAVQASLVSRKDLTQKIEQAIRQRLEEQHIENYAFFARQKHIHSIYEKMREKGISFQEVNDVYGCRILVNDIDACYRTLGIVHNLYKPVAERFKDYIAIPKANGYQSLHTTLFGPYGFPIEIQIRTHNMHHIAQDGVAAHWMYKQGEPHSTDAHVRVHKWLNNLLEIQKNTGNSLEFVENVKIDLFPDEVYVFTPKGKILELPAGATAVDVAYAVHTEIGHTCTAARINRKLAPLSTPLRNGQTVEIITHPQARPNPLWLRFVVTSKARSSIKHMLKNQERNEAIHVGKHLIDDALSQLHLLLENIPHTRVQAVLQESHFTTLEDLYASTGQGKQMPLVIAKRLADIHDTIPLHVSPRRSKPKPLVIQGSEGMFVRFAKCCRPIPGDPVVGILKEDRGLAIHHELCSRIQKYRKQPSALIPACWQDHVQGEFKVDLTLDIHNERGVLAQIASHVAEADANIEDIRVGLRDGRDTRVMLTLSLRHRDDLARVIRKLRHIKAVLRITRKRS